MANAMDPAELEKIFKSFDANGDGKISSSELADVLKQHTVTEQEIETMMSAIDSDGDGFISYDEFVAFAKDNRPLMQHFL